MQRTLFIILGLQLVTGNLAPIRAQTSSPTGPLTEHVSFRGTFDTVWSLSFSRDGLALAAGQEDKTIRVFDVGAGKEVAILRDHKEAVRSVAFSPDGKLLASGSYDGTVKLWSWDTAAVGPDRGKLLATLDAHKGRVLSVAFSPNGKMLASGSFDGTVKLWDVATRKVKLSLDAGTVPTILPAVPRRTSSVAFSPNGNIVGAAASDIGKLWDVRTGKPLAILTIPGFPNPGTLGFDSFGDKNSGDSQSSACFTNQGRAFATTWSGTRDRAPLKLWDTTTGRPRDLLQIRQVAFRVDPGGAFPVIDTLGSDISRTFTISPSGKVVATCGFEFPLTGKEKTAEEVNKVKDAVQNKVEYLVKLWDGNRGNALARLKGHTALILAAAFSPDGTMLASGGKDQTIRIWVVAKALADKKGQ